MADTGSSAITLRDVYAARDRIAGGVRRTPLMPSPSLSRHAGTEVLLKLETMQDIGAFKIRGATNKLRSLDPAQRERGVVTYSTGNHGRATAAAARDLGVNAVVCMSELVLDNKRRAIEDLGAEIRIRGRSQDEAAEEAHRLVGDQGMALVDPIDDPLIIAGQGTIGLEIIEDLPAVGTVVVPLSGGGLIGGIAVAIKTAAPDCRVVGLTMDRGAAMYESLKAGRPVAVDEVPSLADSLGGGIGLTNRYTFALVRDLVDDVVLLNERQIADGMTHLFREDGLVVEGAAAVGAAAILADILEPLRGPVAVVVSGRNVDRDDFIKVVTGNWDFGD